MRDEAIKYSEKKTGTIPSLNAVAQALKTEGVEKDKFFRLLEIPITRLTVSRYWNQSYNIKPWISRNEQERKAAAIAAKYLVKSSKRTNSKESNFLLSSNKDSKIS